MLRWLRSVLRPLTTVVILVLLAALLSGCGADGGTPGPKRDYWPTQGWRAAAPEEHGFDSAKLADALLTMRDQTKLHSLLVIRGGDVVVDAYFYPYADSSPHDLASVTKSIMTTLIGIAVDQGKLKLDDPILSFFPDATLANRDPAMENITVRHLAMMANGLESTGSAQDEGTLTQMEASANWVQFALDRRVVAEPGTQYVYDSPGMHLLSAILQKATGMTALEFARQYLFEPLGIREVIWPADPQGVTQGFTNIVLHPRDAAKIGYLFLNQGRWDGKQIVSREWVAEATKRQIAMGDGNSYGYGWWLPPEETGEYFAFGRGGQYIRILPATYDALIVATGSSVDWDEFISLVAQTLVDPEKSLPANPAGVEKLDAALLAIRQPPSPQPVPPQPAIAQAVSGQTYELEANPFGLTTVQMTFDGSAEAVVRLTFADGRTPWTAPVGLDGVYRMSPAENGLPAAYRGRWEGNDTFVVDLDTAGNRESFVLRLQFDGDRLAFTVREGTHAQGFTVEGRPLN
jgi:CubicO group peptidase (beta-lactamase class C family)